MNLAHTSFFKALRPLHADKSPLFDDVLRFVDALLAFQAEKPPLDEEQAKARFRDFYLTAFPNQSLENHRNPNIDLVLKHQDGSFGALWEVKQPSNKAEMMSMETPNTKALHELVAYYLRARDQKQVQIHHLLATDTRKVFLISEAAFDRWIPQSIRKGVTSWDENDYTTGQAYKRIKEVLSTHEDPLQVVEIDLLESAFQTAMAAFKDGTSTDEDQLKVTTVYKLLSPAHLLLQQIANDGNILNKPFYEELLYLMGLEERKEKNIVTIGRCAPERRQFGSLLESTLEAFSSKLNLETVRETVLDRYLPQGIDKNHHEAREHLAMALVLLWINRILFLKLLEGQLIAFHPDELDAYRFLRYDKETVFDFDDLETLFLSIMAVAHEDRNPRLQTSRYQRLPYLNSALFEHTEIEKATITIGSLPDRISLPRMKGSKIQLDPEPHCFVEYLLLFLEAHNFGAGSAAPTRKEDQPIITPAVLGLVFEKINGYRDGSVYTPGWVTEYICRTTLRHAMVTQFNEMFGWNAQSFSELQTEVRAYLHNTPKPQAYKELNNAVNTLRVLDPAVGSGHFLVSALNELLLAKYELGILCECEPRKESEGEIGQRDYTRLLKADLAVENDELIIRNEHTEPHRYLAKHRPSVQIIQQTLFHEKQDLIENCLFGVDLNANSVEICRLRLWIELLKHAYYKTTDHGDRLETLPNIDINIKAGDSLVERILLPDNPGFKGNKDVGVANFLRKNLQDYRFSVMAYKGSKNKVQKAEAAIALTRIRNESRTLNPIEDKVYQAMKKAEEHGANIMNQAKFDGQSEEAVRSLTVAKERFEKADEAWQKQRKLYGRALEYAFEFPEVLDEDGAFLGFHAVIGNPPYIQIQSLQPEGRKAIYQRTTPQTYTATGDLYISFIERGEQLLRPGGELGMIIQNKWMRSNYGVSFRTWLGERQLRTLLDFGDLPVFPNVTAYPLIISLKKAPPTPETQVIATLVPALPEGKEGLHAIVEELTAGATQPQSALVASGFSLGSGAEAALLAKLRAGGTPLGEYVNGQIYRGVLTGLNEAFVIDGATRARLIAEDGRSAEVIKPMVRGRDVKRYVTPAATQFLILFPKGSTIDQFGKLSEAEAFARMQAEYSSVMGWLSSFEERARKRGDKGDYWWELRACDYYDKFEAPKIVYQVFQVAPLFTLSLDVCYCNNATYIMPIKSFELIAVLNSKIGWHQIKIFCAFIQNGYQLMWDYFKNIYIPPMTDAQKATLSDLAARRMDAVEPEASELDAEIDALVYALYDLTAEEIAVVEGSVR